jgi:alanine racemase
MAESFFRSQPSPGEIEERMEGYPSWIEVDLDRLGFNLDQIRKRVGVEVIPCVKKNAYGHGIVPVVAYLNTKGVERVLVAKLWEALQLREAGLTCGIINVDPLFREDQFGLVVERDITQAVFSGETADMLSKAAGNLGKEAQAFIKVDTGLGRVGVRYEEAVDLIEYVSNLSGVEVGGIFSTFSEDAVLDPVQLERILSIEKELMSRGVDPGTKSIASSYAILHFPDSGLDAVRPGITLFGLYPEEEDRELGLELKQVISMKGRLEHVKWIEGGDSLTYSRAFIAPRRMRVGTVHIGHSDGYPRELMNKGRILVEGEFRSILGAISTNHSIVDLTDVDAKQGDVAEYVGKHGENTVVSIAKVSGVSTYRFCVGLSPLTPRVYHEGGKPVALSEPRLTDR